MKVCFVSGTRADYGKIKPLINVTNHSSNFDAVVFVTGMHMHKRYGYTVNEIIKDGFDNFQFINDSRNSSDMDIALANTVVGLSNFIRESCVDIVVVHGDRLEALAGAIVGAFNNLPVIHIEGGEKSGTIDESIRHAVSKLAHIHMVSTKDAGLLLEKMGEMSNSIYVIGSPDIDLMFSPDLPNLKKVKERYEIPFASYAIFMLHPVTTDNSSFYDRTKTVLNTLYNQNINTVIIYPNNDKGSDEILRAIEDFEGVNGFLSFPSIRFEYFLTLLRNSNFIIGNSSAGIREAYYYGVPSINIGDRQSGRDRNELIFDVEFDEKDIAETIRKVTTNSKVKLNKMHGEGDSAKMFLEVLESIDWDSLSLQKRLNALY